MTSPTALLRVVDDHDAGRFGKVQRLRRAGYRVIEASNGYETLRLAEASQPDLVLLDVNLPDLGGVEVCRRLKALAVSPALQVLHLSSTSISDADRVQGLANGADAYLTEPVSDEVLLATVGALLRVRRAELALAGALARERDAREAAEQANRFKDDFLATLSHELRTPLNSMVGWIWQLQHSIVDDAVRQRAFAALEQSTAAQMRLINELLDVSRIGKGKIELDLADVDLAGVVEAAVESVHAAMNAKALVVTVSLSSVYVWGDTSRLRQVVVNLLTNAIQFSDRGGHIDIALDAAGSEAELRVRDTGHGIAAELLPFVFDQFRQGERGFARKHGGLGLGLAIVKQLVTLHGGVVHAESDGSGLGATFTVRMPRSAHVANAAHREAAIMTSGLAGSRVLVVDNDEDSRAWLKALIEKAGGVAVTVPSAAHALDAVTTQAFDLVVSDIGMPDTDGIEFLGSLRRQGHHIPAVAVTAFSTPGEKARILLAGFRAHIAKPIQPNDFIRQLSEVRADTPMIPEES